MNSVMEMECPISCLSHCHSVCSFAQNSIGLQKQGENLHKKTLFLRVSLVLFAETCFSLPVFKLQGIQISKKLTRKIVLKANTRFVTSTTSFLSES